MHRFVWPLHRALPAELSHGNAYADGRWVPPGHYTVALTVDGRSFQQPLEVVPDPRVALPAAAYARQDALAGRIEAAQIRLALAQAEAQTIHKALLALDGDARSGAEARRLDADVTDLAGLTRTANPANAWAVPVTSLQSFRYLDGALGQLLRAVEGADADPSPDAVAGIARLESRLTATLATWKSMKDQTQALEAHRPVEGK
jgi:hypothetical protein